MPALLFTFTLALAFACTGSFALMASAAPACPHSAAECEILREYSLEPEPTELTQKIAAALIGLRDLPSLAEAGPALRRNFLSRAPYDFFRQQVAALRIGAAECRNAGIVAYVANANSRTVYVCPFATNLTTLSLQSNLLHEARHLHPPEVTSGAVHAHPHRLCSRGQFVGTDACDTTYDQGGSYAVQTEFFLRVSRTPALPESMRQEARGLALVYLREHFDSLPFPVREGALLSDEEGALTFYDGVSPPTNLLSGITGDQIVSLRSMPTLFDASSGQVTTYAGDGAFMETPGSMAKMYRAFSAQERAEILDVYYGGNQACFLEKQSVYCELGDQSVRLPMPTGVEPTQLNVFPMFGGDLVSVVSREGDFYPLPLDKFAEDWAGVKLAKNNTLSGNRSVSLLPGGWNLGIGLSGELFTFKNIREPRPVEEFRGKKFRKILAPFYWSKELGEI